MTAVRSAGMRTRSARHGSEALRVSLRRALLLVAALFGLGVAVPAAAQRPRLNVPSIVVFEPGPDGFFALSLSGTAFGGQVPQSSVEVSGYTVDTNRLAVRMTFAGDDPAIVVWDDDFIVVRVNRAPFVGLKVAARVWIWNAAQARTSQSNSAKADVYRLSRYDLHGAHAPAGRRYAPGNMWGDRSGRLFISSEFYTRNGYWVPPRGRRILSTFP